MVEKGNNNEFKTHLIPRFARKSDLGVKIKETIAFEIGMKMTCKSLVLENFN